jgi:hypothetical protein
MPRDAASALQKIIEYCSDKWIEADKPSDAPYPTPDMQTGKKMAYHDVLNYASRLLNELPDKRGM